MKSGCMSGGKRQNKAVRLCCTFLEIFHFFIVPFVLYFFCICFLAIRNTFILFVLFFCLVCFFYVLQTISINNDNDDNEDIYSPMWDGVEFDVPGADEESDYGSDSSMEQFASLATYQTNGPSLVTNTVDDESHATESITNQKNKNINNNNSTNANSTHVEPFKLGLSNVSSKSEDYRSSDCDSLEDNNAILIGNVTKGLGFGLSLYESDENDSTDYDSDDENERKTRNNNIDATTASFNLTNENINRSKIVTSGPRCMLEAVEEDSQERMSDEFSRSHSKDLTIQTHNNNNNNTMANLDLMFDDLSLQPPIDISITPHNATSGNNNSKFTDFSINLKNMFGNGLHNNINNENNNRNNNKNTNCNRRFSNLLVQQSCTVPTRSPSIQMSNASLLSIGSDSSLMRDLLTTRKTSDEIKSNNTSTPETVEKIGDKESKISCKQVPHGTSLQIWTNMGCATANHSQPKKMDSLNVCTSFTNSPCVSVNASCTGLQSNEYIWNDNDFIYFPTKNIVQSVVGVGMSGAVQKAFHIPSRTICAIKVCFAYCFYYYFHY